MLFGKKNKQSQEETSTNQYGLPTFHDLDIPMPKVKTVQRDEAFYQAENRIEKALREGHLSLALSSMNLKTIPDSIGQLSNLQMLFLHENQLTTVPEAIGQLSNLQKLYLSNNQLTTVPEAIGQLSNLQELYLYNNQLTTVPEAIGQLSNLQKLYLYNNQLTTVPEAIGQLSNLQWLYLHENQLTTVPEEIGQLSNLQTLSLSNNQLQSLPESMQRLSQLEKLYLHGNPDLGIPIEVLGATWQNVQDRNATPAKPKDILNYYFRIRNQKTPLNEAKLILVGFGAVGKTSLVNRLVYKRFDGSEKQTEGISISQWKFGIGESKQEQVKLHVWDFGGQEIMHNTHQFFLTERSLYLLVLNGRQGHEDEDANYWLELIQSFGNDSPVILVLNKIKECPFDLNRRGLQQKFPNLKTFVETDCATGTGIDSLHQVIEEQTNALPHLRDGFPGSWFKIKDRLSSMGENYISFDKYRDLCREHGERDSTAQEQLAFYLHSLGIVLNYKDDPRLQDTHVLNPHWLTNGIYKLLNAQTLTQQHGELSVADLKSLLDQRQYPPERHYFLLELMRKFELCFRFLENDDRYLIPDLLDKQQPLEAETFDPKTCLNFFYDYPIVPEGLLPRFIVRTHVLSNTHKLRWRTGVILHFEGNRALVKADRSDKQITINIDGPLSSRNRLLAIIRFDFDNIHNCFSFSTPPRARVPLPDYPQASISYESLLIRERKGRTTIEVEWEGEVLEFNVQDLLNGVDLDHSRTGYQRGEQRLPKLFYSYSHKDEALKDELETHLKLLQRQNLIWTWHDRCILPGLDWKKELDERLEQAQIILLLVSADFLASDYCYEIEMKRALQRHDQGKAIVVPIILRDVDWKSAPFAKLSVLPKDGIPVRRWDDRDTAWRNVEEGLRATIQQKWGLP
jgi:internalin A